MKERSSNFELLRIIAMLMVLTLHCISPTPWPYGKVSNLSTHIGISTIYFLSIVAVNAFVLISGWFGIKTTGKRLLQFCFQILFAGAIGLGFHLIQNPTFGFYDLLSAFYLTKDSIPFAKCYLGLMILAPIINTYIEHVSEQSLRNTLLAFLGFEIIFGAIFNTAFVELILRFSIVSFIGLYLLGRYLKLYGNKIPYLHQLKASSSTLIFFASYAIPLISIGIIASLAFWFYNIHLVGYISAYTFPLIIATAVALLLFFSTLKIQSRTINIIARNVFAVYLIHEHPFISKHFAYSFLDIYNTTEGLENLLYSTLFILAVFLVCISIDFVRLAAWKWLEKRLYK